MNIFVTDASAKFSAVVLDDKRLNKMIIESAQILSAAMHLSGETGPYKLTHKNHPCVKWVLKDKRHFGWLCDHLHHLSEEFHLRFKKPHKTYQYMQTFDNSKLSISNYNYYDLIFTNVSFFKDETDVFKAYQKTLVIKWGNDKKPPKWTNSYPPPWYDEIKKELFSIDYNYVS